MRHATIAATATMFAAVAAAPLLLASDATACGRAIELETQQPTMLLAEADRLLGEGRWLEASRKADEANFDDLTWKQTWWRARILSTAAIRSEGAMTPRVRDYRGEVENPATRRKNVADAVARLERMLKKDVDNPALKSVLGEGLAQIPHRADDARALLTSLADDDLITDARTWAAIARLRAAAGDVNGQKVALTSCRAMARDPQAECSAARSTADVM